MLVNCPIWKSTSSPALQAWKPSIVLSHFSTTICFHIDNKNMFEDDIIFFLQKADHILYKDSRIATFFRHLQSGVRCSVFSPICSNSVQLILSQILKIPSKFCLHLHLLFYSALKRQNHWTQRETESNLKQSGIV